ncbi:MAG: hypothetical protein ACTSQY_09210 [Candidatus Odinarchaeia archaeon]
MSLLSDFNQVKHMIANDVIIEEYNNETLEAYIPNQNLVSLTDKIKRVALELEAKYTRPVHIYVSKSRCIIKLR